MLELVFLSGVRSGVAIPVSHSLVAGRDAECSLEIPDPRVSRVHARIEWDGTRCQLVDQDSSNGTFVNEKPVTRVELQNGDIVRLGSTRLRVQARSAMTATSAEPPSIFELRDARPAEMSHAFSMDRLDQKEADADPEVLRARLSSMIRVSELLSSVRSLDDISEPVLDLLFGLLPQTDRAFLMLGDRVETLEPKAMRHRDEGLPGPLKVSRSICRAALEKKAAIVYREGGEQPIDPSMSMIDLEIRSAIAVPLAVNEEIVGLVVVDTRDAAKGYGQRDLEIAAAACHQVAIAIKNAQLVAEVQEQTATRNNLMRFLPQAMADQVLEGKLDAGLGGRKHVGSFLFSDIVGFTERAEHTPPDRLVRLLNRFFNVVVPWIEVDGGSVDKFMGDAILAVWGIPMGSENSAVRAVTAALSMQASLAAFNSEQDQPLHMGIGINSGEVVAGNVGTENRLEYTVLGDAVNTAQRVGAAACLDQILVTETTWDSIPDRRVGVRMPPLVAKNKSAPIDAFSVRGIEIGEELQLFVPVRYGEHAAWLIRRLADHSFILLHPPTPPTELTLDLVELAPIQLGSPEQVRELPPEGGDGCLRRSLIRLQDDSLGGLLGETPLASDRTWPEMDRAETSQVRR